MYIKNRDLELRGVIPALKNSTAIFYDSPKITLSGIY